MKIYIVDDDVSIVKMIEEIVLDGNLGEIVGTCDNSLTALDEVCLLKPDILIVDLLMPELDGITFVERFKRTSPASKCIMVSQVSSKKIVGDAYEKGITFFISKPVNKKEIRQVIKNLTDQIHLENNLKKIKQVLALEEAIPQNNETSPEAIDLDIEKKFRMIFSRLGILGEVGCDEIIRLCLHVIHSRTSSSNVKLKDLSSGLSDNPKAMEQRIRRTINKGLSNIANLGIEDYLNETYVKYSNTLFDFDQVRQEMEFIRGKKSTGGKINIKKFMDNLILIVEEM
ncbi:MAG: response regulator [Firmicutes bacterium]|nr:response regulator [Bacillota bacterium]